MSTIKLPDVYTWTSTTYLQGISRWGVCWGFRRDFLTCNDRTLMIPVETTYKTAKRHVECKSYTCVHTSRSRPFADESRASRRINYLQLTYFLAGHVDANWYTYIPVEMHFMTHFQGITDNIYDFLRLFAPFLPIHHPSTDVSTHPQWVLPIQMTTGGSLHKAVLITPLCITSP